MKQWEIYKLDLPNLGPHRVVVISRDSVCANDSIKTVNALLCSTVRNVDRISEFESGLHDAEGFEFLTGCQCHSFLTISKQRFQNLETTGVVSLPRRDDIKRKIKVAFNL